VWRRWEVVERRRKEGRRVQKGWGGGEEEG
jgi:hypothetical protein